MSVLAVLLAAPFLGRKVEAPLKPPSLVIIHAAADRPFLGRKVEAPLKCLGRVPSLAISPPFLGRKVEAPLKSIFSRL